MPLFSSGTVISYAKLCDVKSKGTEGGSYTANTEIVRTLNTVEVSQFWVSLANNQFTLTRGKYWIVATVPAFLVGRFRGWIWNVTDSQIQLLGQSGYALSQSTISICNGLIDISTSKTFEVRMQGSVSRSDGLGQTANIGTQQEVYTIVEIIQIG